jgi:hypothetical protein
MLVIAGSNKYGEQNFKKMVLEKTGAEIDEEDVFLSLQDAEIITLLREGELWKPQVTIQFIFNNSDVFVLEMEDIPGLFLLSA